MSRADIISLELQSLEGIAHAPGRDWSSIHILPRCSNSNCDLNFPWRNERTDIADEDNDQDDGELDYDPDRMGGDSNLESDAGSVQDTDDNKDNTGGNIDLPFAGVDEHEEPTIKVIKTRKSQQTTSKKTMNGSITSLEKTMSRSMSKP